MQFGTAELRRGAFGQPSVPFLLSRRAHLLTTPKGRWYCLRQPCALRGGCGSCGSLWTMPQLCGAAVIVHAGCSRFLFGNNCNPACENLPPAALSQRWTALPLCPFSLLRKRNRKIGGEATWQFITWKQRWSAVGPGALPLRQQPI